MKIGDKVNTEDGPGVIVAIENPDGRSKRYAVKLDEPLLFDFIPHYFEHELKAKPETELTLFP